MKTDPRTTRAAPCPTCHYYHDAAMCIDDDTVRPKPGDFSVCLRCGEILCFTADLSLRLADLDDFMDLDKKISALLTRAQTKIRRARPLDRKHE